MDAVAETNYELVTVYYNGVKADYRLTDLDVAPDDDGNYNPTDAAILEAVTMELGDADFTGFRVDRYNRVISITPNPEFGLYVE